MSFLLAVAIFAVSGADCPEATAVAKKAYEDRRYEQAAQQFARAVAECGASGALLLALGQSQLLAQHPAEALKSLDRIKDNDPDYVQALKVRAKAHYLLARDQDAEASLKLAAARSPSDAEIPYDLGRIYYQIGRHAEAAAMFRRAISLDSTAYKAWDNLGLASEALGDVEEAKRNYLKAIALVHQNHPHYDVVYANFAELLTNLGEFQRAFDLAAEAAERNREEPRNFYLAGKALVQIGRSDISIRWFEQAIALDSDYAEAYYQLSQAYRRLGRAADADRALKSFQAASARARRGRR
jgi:tetratricopeptide (TPR) repeat protein